MSDKPLKPTSEQQDCIDKFQTGKKLRINAYAGTGKSSTLKLIGRSTEKGGTCIMFNKAVADEARKTFPSNITCSTQHSLAFHVIKARGYPVEKMTGNLNGGYLAKRLHLQSLDVTRELRLTARQHGFLISETVKRWMRSGRPEISPWDVPLDGKLETLDKSTTAALQRQIARRAAELWGRMSDPRSDMPLSHDGYLKLWALGRPQIPGRFVMLDEAQDCQPDGTIVYVAEGERGNKDSLTKIVPRRIEDIKIGDRVVSHRSSSLRKMGSEVTTISSRLHDGDIIEVTTQSGATSRYTPEHICLAKIGPALTGKSIVYLMQKGTSFRVGITAAKYGSHAWSGFAGRMHDEKADAMWVLATFESKADALIEEARVGVAYGIPEMRFLDGGQRTIGADRLRQFWDSLGDMTEKAKSCLAAFNRRIEHPITRRKFNDDGVRESYMMHYRAATIRACNLLDGMEVLDVRNFLDKPSERVTTLGEGWTPIAVRRKPYTGNVWSMSVEPDHTYVADGIVTHNCNGVILEVMKHQEAQVICVGDRHQAIYEWRGAVNAMELLPVELEARLSTSFRFGPAIAGYATSILELLGETVPLTGNPAKSSSVGPIDAPTTILFRTNGRLLERVFELIEAKKRPHIVGGVKDIQAFISAAEKLMAGQSVDSPLELFGFKDWEDVQQTSEMPGEDELRRWVKLIDGNGTEKLRATLYGLPQEERLADVVLSTGHKAKGREWSSVRLEDDFLRGVRTKDEEAEKRPVTETGAPADVRKGNPAIDSELRLFYVAATRGQVRLEVPPKLTEKLEKVRAQRKEEKKDAA